MPSLLCRKVIMNNGIAHAGYAHPCLRRWRSSSTFDLTAAENKGKYNFYVSQINSAHQGFIYFPYPAKCCTRPWYVMRSNNYHTLILLANNTLCSLNFHQNIFDNCHHTYPAWTHLIYLCQEYLSSVFPMRGKQLYSYKIYQIFSIIHIYKSNFLEVQRNSKGK